LFVLSSTCFRSCLRGGKAIGNIRDRSANFINFINSARFQFTDLIFVVQQMEVEREKQQNGLKNGYTKSHFLIVECVSTRVDPICTIMPAVSSKILNFDLFVYFFSTEGNEFHIPVFQASD